MKVSFIIPCFNEENNIKSTIEEVIAHVNGKLPQIEYEIICINDGSTDRTLEKLYELEKQYTHNIKIVNFKTNKGRGTAIKAGISISLGYYIIPLDADLSYDVNHITEILNEFSNNSALDVVVISAYAKGGIVKGVPFGRLLLSRMANWILAGFFEVNISTVTCVVRGYRGELIRKIKFFENGKELHLEILRKLILYGANIKEIPGRLIWKKQKISPRRKNNLKVFAAAKKHLLYAMMIKPTKLFGVATLVLISAGIYECLIISISVIKNFELVTGGCFYSLWLALSKSYSISPHTFFLALSCLVIGIQSASFLALLQVLKLQQEETLRHVLALLENTNRME